MVGGLRQEDQAPTFVSCVPGLVHEECLPPISVSEEPIHTFTPDAETARTEAEDAGKTHIALTRATTADILTGAERPPRPPDERPEPEGASAPSALGALGSGPLGRRNVSIASFGAVFQISHQKTCLRASRMKRMSAIAVDFQLRAASTHEELRNALFVIDNMDDTSWTEDVPLAMRLRFWLLGTSMAFVLCSLAFLSLVSGTGLLAFEPVCESREARNIVSVFKKLHLASTVVYLALAAGQLWALDWEPLIAAQYFFVRLVNAIRHREDRVLAQLWGRDSEVPLTNKCMLLLDTLVFVAFLAEIVHITEEPTDWPSPVQWFWLLNVVKAWRMVYSPMLNARPTHQGLFVRLTWLLGLLFCFVHVCACMFALTALFSATQGKATWADQEGSLKSEVRYCSTFYTAAFYFSAYTVSSVGHGDIVPANSLERNLDSVLMLVSQMYAALVFAEFNFIITTHRYWSGQRHHRQTQTEAALRSMGVPDQLFERVLAYQDFVWEVHRERRAKESLSDLSDCLKEELKTILYHRLVSQAPFLQQLSAQAVRQIISSLTDEVHLPSDFIVARGSDGTQLFFLREGIAGVFVTNSPPAWCDTEVKVVGRGEYFGEVSLLTGAKRTCWVMARTYCVTSELQKRIIEEVISKDPSCVVKLAKSMQKSLGVASAHRRWDDVAQRLDRLGVELEDLWYGYCKPLVECPNLDIQDVEEPDMTVMSWAGFQALMGDLSIQEFEQKLLWIDLDKEETGWITVQRFIQVAYAGSRDTEVAKFEAARRNSTLTGPAVPSGWQAPLQPGAVAATEFRAEEPATPRGGSSTRPTSTVCRSAPEVPSGKRREVVDRTKIVQQHVVKLGERIEGRLDDLCSQVTALTKLVHDSLAMPSLPREQ